MKGDGTERRLRRMKQGEGIIRKGAFRATAGKATIEAAEPKPLYFLIRRRRRVRRRGSERPENLPLGRFSAESGPEGPGQINAEHAPAEEIFIPLKFSGREPSGEQANLQSEKSETSLFSGASTLSMPKAVRT
ncbi:MAG: hypothetical protein J5564_03200, partial [Clostridia bacterium]|nr:hypothetical protein [Clostridia bacterium]